MSSASLYCSGIGICATVPVEIVMLGMSYYLLSYYVIYLLSYLLIILCNYHPSIFISVRHLAALIRADLPLCSQFAYLWLLSIIVIYSY